MNVKRTIARLVLAAATCALISCGEEKGASVSFVQPVDGATVERSFKVVMAVDGMTVHEAGEVIPGTGHHHIIIDGGYIPLNEVIVKDREHLHYGKGQTEAELHLYPGKHTLTLQFANGNHKSYGSALSKTITVNVK